MSAVMHDALVDAGLLPTETVSRNAKRPKSTPGAFGNDVNAMKTEALRRWLDGRPCAKPLTDVLQSYLDACSLAETEHVRNGGSLPIEGS